jgi:hypothetical protein
MDGVKVHIDGIGVVEDYQKYHVGLWELLPHWAEAKATEEEGVLEMFSHMATKDGRRCSNGVVVSTKPCSYQEGKVIYTVKTEVGNTVSGYYSEIMELYHKPMYIKTKEAFTTMCKVWELYGKEL